MNLFDLEQTVLIIFLNDTKNIVTTILLKISILNQLYHFELLY